MKFFLPILFLLPLPAAAQEPVMSEETFTILFARALTINASDKPGALAASIVLPEGQVSFSRFFVPLVRCQLLIPATNRDLPPLVEGEVRASCIADGNVSIPVTRAVADEYRQGVRPWKGKERLVEDWDGIYLLKSPVRLRFLVSLQSQVDANGEELGFRLLKSEELDL